MSEFKSPRGVRDILPPETARWRALERQFAAVCERAGYGELVSPMFEEAGVFARLGEETSVVSKEMYDFHDKDGRQMALRPELTASAARAFIEHHPVVPWKIWYVGPQFRYERPQAGRYRQFTQVGIELFGVDDPHSDVEVISLGWEFLRSLGLQDMTLLLNSLGDIESRSGYAAALGDYLAANMSGLSEASQETAQRNPLRVLDSKREQDQQIIAEAPDCLDHLTPEAADRFSAVRDGLDAISIPYEIAPRLVRGLDYYTHTAFEYVSNSLATAQNALGGGGRYDGLIEALGGNPTPGIGFALGADRILLACDAEDTFPLAEPTLDVFIIDTTGGQAALALTQELRASGISADRAWNNRSLKAQMKAANRSKARYALIIGPDEQASDTVSVKDLATSEQTIEKRYLISEIITRKLSGNFVDS